MTSTEKRAIKIALAFAGLTMGATGNASAQDLDYGARLPQKSDVKEDAKEPAKKTKINWQIEGRELELSKAERKAIAAVEAALTKQDYPKAASAITEAQRVAVSADARYAIAARELQLGSATNDVAMQDRAVEAALASGVAPASVLPTLYRRQGIAAIQASNYAKADTAFTQLVSLSPDDADAVLLLAETKNRSDKPAEALPLFEKAIQLKTASGQPVTAAWNEVVAALKHNLKVRASK